MPSFTRRLPLALALAGATLILQACVPIFSGGVFQSLELTFKLDDAVRSGEKKLFHTVVFPEKVKVKANWLQISGRLGGSSGDLPSRIEVEARLEDLDTGRPSQRISITLTLDRDGLFSGSKKIKKNVKAGEMLTVTLEPSGADIPKGTEIALCVDLVKKRADLDDLPACVEGAGGGGSQVTFTSIQSNILTPTCAVGGCHNASAASAGLVLEPGRAFGNLVDVPSSQQPSFDRVEPGNPDRSYLVKKLRGDSDISGSRMPRGGSPLSSQQLDQIVRWIQAGAPNN